MEKRILSGMRPTGKLHLGHLVGALNNWVSLQDSYKCFYMVADWHALMSEYEDPAGLKENSYEMVRDFISGPPGRGHSRLQSYGGPRRHRPGPAP